LAARRQGNAHHGAPLNRVRMRERRP
jgi:hypothetical protein